MSVNGFINRYYTLLFYILFDIRFFESLYKGIMMLLTFYSIFFGKDGNIYFNKNNRSEFIKEKDFKRVFLNFGNDEKAKNFMFWTALLNNTVYFEDGITIESVWNCLRESSDFWSSLLGIDIEAYLEELDKPPSNNIYKGGYDCVLAYNIPKLALESYDGANFYHIHMIYDIKGFNNKNGIVYSENISHIPLNEIKHLPFYFERVNGVFLEEDVKPKFSNNISLLSAHKKETRLNEAVYAIFSHHFKSPFVRDNRNVATVNLNELAEQRNHYNSSIEKLKNEEIELDKNLNQTMLPDNIKSKCSTVLPYALKRCK